VAVTTWPRARGDGGAGLDGEHAGQPLDAALGDFDIDASAGANLPLGQPSGRAEHHHVSPAARALGRAEGHLAPGRRIDVDAELLVPLASRVRLRPVARSASSRYGHAQRGRRSVTRYTQELPKRTF
jgi:hypothetical protein